MSDSMLKADPGRQRLVFLFAVLIVAVCARVIYELDIALEEIRNVAMLDAARAAGLTMRLTDLFLQGISWAFGLVAFYLLIQGARILRAGQHPLPGAKVVLDTSVVKGRAAQRRAGGGLVLAVMLIVAALWVPTVGRERVASTIVLPTSVDEQPPVTFDPDSFLGPVPGEVLSDPQDPQHPLNRGRASQKAKESSESPTREEKRKP